MKITVEQIDNGWLVEKIGGATNGGLPALPRRFYEQTPAEMVARVMQMTGALPDAVNDAVAGRAFEAESMTQEQFEELMLRGQ